MHKLFICMLAELKRLRQLNVRAAEENEVSLLN